MKHLLKVIPLIVIFTLAMGMIASAGNAAGQEKLQVPLRFICEARGATVAWDTNTGTAKAEMGDKTLSVKPGSKQASVNGKNILLDSEIPMVNGRLKVPLSLINDAFGTDITPDDYMKIIAAKYVDLLSQDAVTDCTLLLSGNLSRAITPDLVKQLGMTFKSFGELKAGGVAVSKTDVHQNVTLTYTAAALGQFDFIVRFGSEGLIDDFMLKTGVVNIPYKTPEYDKPDNYTEREVVIGEGEWALPGTLTIPRGKGPFPAVVLVHGSGPNDRDETLGPLKPFRDLAAGLAAQNIAVFRYEKRTTEHNAKIAFIKTLTVKEETVDDAVAAVKLLATIPEIDAGNIFVLGHSQGAMLMPRIIQADKDGKIKGGIVMSGPSRSFQALFVEQYEYLAGLGMATKDQAEAIKKQMDMIDSPDFSAENPPKGFTMGNSYWWADLKDYNPVQMAKGETTPLLILQGERDYQVSAKADFQGWKDGLGTRAGVTFKLYPKLNHMYTEGEGALSTPVEYYTAANVPDYVIDDIAQWVNTAAK